MEQNKIIIPIHYNLIGELMDRYGPKVTGHNYKEWTELLGSLSQIHPSVPEIHGLQVGDF